MWEETLVKVGEDMVSETSMRSFICVEINFWANWTFVPGNNSHVTMFILNPYFEVRGLLILFHFNLDKDGKTAVDLARSHHEVKVSFALATSHFCLCLLHSR